MRELYPGISLTTCEVCGEAKLISHAYGVCLECIRKRPQEALRVALNRHRASRLEFGLPEEPPRHPDGIPCNLCVNQCRIREGELGYCGMKTVRDGRLIHIYGKDDGLLDYYDDPIPTNCVAAWICGATGRGYPKFSVTPQTEHGYVNLAVFYRACTYNCLFCQNWHFKIQDGGRYTPEKLAEAVGPRTSCICYFGGDPAAQILHSIRTALVARQKHKGILRICWETNGSANPAIMQRIAQIALISGGTVKIDLKAYHPTLHQVLTGVSNEWTIENIRRLAKLISERPNPPLLVVSVLLIPGYIDLEEIQDIVDFLADLNPEIPLSLLAFAPQFLVDDLPPTSRRHAEAALEIAQQKLRNVHLGNLHLLW